MYCNFTAYTLLPLADVTAIGFAAPLFIVMLAAFLLRERVHIYRWSAVVIGFVGVLVIIGPGARMASGATIGVAYALTSAALAALAMIFLRRMSAHEHSTAIAFYFMLTASVISLFTLPFGWNFPTGTEGWVLIASGLAGGVGQLFLSFSYRYGEASLLAPFDYTAMIWAARDGHPTAWSRTARSPSTAGRPRTTTASIGVKSRCGRHSPGRAMPPRSGFPKASAGQTCFAPLASLALQLRFPTHPASHLAPPASVCWS